MALKDIIKKGNTVPLTTDLVEGGFGIDTTNKKVYSKDASGNVFEVGSKTPLEIRTVTGVNTYLMPNTNTDALVDGLTYLIQVSNKNTSNSTLQVDSFPAYEMVDSDRNSLASGYLEVGHVYIAKFMGNRFETRDIANTGSEHYNSITDPTLTNIVSQGATWYKEDTSVTYKRVNDGTNDLWIDISGQVSGSTTLLDEDDMATDSHTLASSQAGVKAYVTNELTNKADILQDNGTTTIYDDINISSSKRYKLIIDSGTLVLEEV